MASKEVAQRGSELAGRNSGARGDGTLIMEDARIVFRNFAGAEGMYNREGDRNFCVLLDEDLAQQMIADGWNIKRLKPREDEEVGTAYIQVSVGFKIRPPRMVLLSSKGRLDLLQPDEDGRIDESECVLFDWADILKADLIIRPYHWNVSGKTGIKAYLKSLFITINEDYLELKYADVPAIEAGSSNNDAVQMTAEALQNQAYENQDPNDEVYDAEVVE